MIEQRLIDIINSGRAWAFVGSGASVDTGLPTWQDLYVRVVRSLGGAAPRDTPPPDTLPRSFGKLTRQYGRPEVLPHVTNQLTTVTQPGSVHRLLASWPFAAYVTTNYDTLLDTSVNAYSAWVTIGNAPSETKKISGEVSGIVWHPHGIINAPDTTSHLVLSQDDYDAIYPAGSPIFEGLKALLRMRSLVFVGFGFNDPDLAQLLELVARLSDPGQPAYAFLSGSTPARRNELRTKYNVVTIPYNAPGGDHSELLSVLRHYSYFIADRNVSFGGTPSPPPRYDPAVTSLIVQNALHSGFIELPHTTRERVMRASVLAALSTHGSLTERALEQHVRTADKGPDHALFQSSLDHLLAAELVARSDNDIVLTPAATALTAQRQAAAQLSFQQFLAAIHHRAAAYLDDTTPEAVIQRVSDVAALFFESICKRRGLAIAQNLSGGPEGHVQRRAVALIQELPEWFSRCQSLSETRALTNVVSGVLSEPTNAEKVYLGFLTQAYFGRHIAGVEEESIALRRQLLSSTAFILDSHFVIVLLARGCTAHDHAVELVRLLADADAGLVVTDLILVETIEHLEWAMKELGAGGRGTSLQSAFDVVRGVSGHSNSFLLGYSACLADGGSSSFGQYVVTALGQQRAGQSTSTMVRAAIADYGIRLDVKGLLQAEPEFAAASAELVDRITARRQDYSSYKHERQVLAEAQVVALVAGIRDGSIQANGADAPQALFLTDSRILDGLEGCPQRICITPEGLHQWLLSTRPFTPDMAANVFDHLLLELLESGVQFVPTERITTAFGSIVQAGREQIHKLVAEHRAVIETQYGPDHEPMLSRIEDLLVVDAVEFLSNTVLREQTSRLAAEEAKRRDAEKKLKALEALQDDVARYQRRLREKQRRRAAQSRPKTKKEKQKERRRKHARK